MSYFLVISRKFRISENYIPVKSPINLQSRVHFSFCSCTQSLFWNLCCYFYILFFYYLVLSVWNVLAPSSSIIIQFIFYYIPMIFKKFFPGKVTLCASVITPQFPWNHSFCVFFYARFLPLERKPQIVRYFIAIFVLLPCQARWIVNVSFQ